LWACPPPTSPPDEVLEGCADTEALLAQGERLAAWFAELSAGVAAQPAEVVLPEDTNGVLEMGLQPDLLPLLVGPRGVHAAASWLGDGRVVAFSGQDFLSSGDRSTLLSEAPIRALLRNAAHWAGGGGALRVLADNDAVAAVLEDGTSHSVEVTPVVEVQGLRRIHDWSAGAVAGFDLLALQVNEWGTLHVSDADIAAIRSFVQGGGGLLIAGSALHWSWWLSDQGPAFPGDAILEGAGIRWTPTSAPDLQDAVLSFDELSAPESLWCAYVTGRDIDDGVLPRVAPLFGAASESGRDAEVDDALGRLIDDTPALPVSVEDGAARLSSEVGTGLRAHPWPKPHPWLRTFPGEVAANAERVDLVIPINTARKRATPLRAFAAGGSVVTIRIPQDQVRTGLSVRVGEPYDDLRSLDHIDTWRRAPLLVQSYPVDAPILHVGNGFGGALYLVVPDDHPTTTFDVEVEGAVEMAVFSEGVTDPAGFDAALRAGAPQAILQRSGAVRMVVPADAVSSVPDPAAVTSFWEGFHASHFDLAQEPIPRRFESHWIFDPQVGWGYANATRERITFPDLAVGWALRTQTGDEDWWLFGHELGHQFQNSDWSGGDITEVAVNLFTMFTLNGYILGGGNFETRGHRNNTMDHMSLIDARWASEGLFGKLEMYRQLVFEFGWDAFRQTFASYYDPAYPRSTYGSYMDGFALRFSALVARDLTPFFDHWEYPLNGTARSRIQSWGLTPWLPPGW
jgi:hypothetical protein